MPSNLRTRAATLLAAALLIVPAAAGAQSAGDEQYADPFQGDGRAQGQDQGSDQNTPDDSGSSQDDAGTGTPAPTAPTAPTAEEAQGAQTAPAAPVAGPQLPRTGSDPRPLLAAGALLLLTGGLARRLTRPA